jgi:DNA-binding MarR family transcriptional regulator
MEPESRADDDGPLIGALLRGCWQAVRTRIRHDLIAGGFDDIGAAHLAVFQYPSPRGVRLTALADGAGMSRQAITYLVRELEGKGYLERRPDPSDRRASLVHLTDRGEAAVRAIRASVRRLERDWERKLGSSRFEQFRGTLLAVTPSLPGASERELTDQRSDLRVRRPTQ